MNQSKIATIMGVGFGLGTAIAHRFAREGFTFAMMARSKEKLTPHSNLNRTNWR
jgi:NADP-dependent 3-hydroxy acid dehydrogenase YdfG